METKSRDEASFPEVFWLTQSDEADGWGKSTTQSDDAEDLWRKSVTQKLPDSLSVSQTSDLRAAVNNGRWGL